jgi:hypothetical protein
MESSTKSYRITIVFQLVLASFFSEVTHTPAIIKIPAASLIIEKYLKGEIRGDDRKNLEKRMLEANLLNVKP